MTGGRGGCRAEASRRISGFQRFIDSRLAHGIREGWLRRPAVVRAHAQQKMSICRDLAGATGLEPATSGMTGRNGEENVGTGGKQSQVSCAVSPPQSAISIPPDARRNLPNTCQEHELPLRAEGWLTIVCLIQRRRSCSSVAARRASTTEVAACMDRRPVMARKNASRPSTKSLESTVALTVAVRGTSRMRAISPK